MTVLEQSSGEVACRCWSMAFDFLKSEQSVHHAHGRVPPRLLRWHVFGVEVEGASAGSDVHLKRRHVPRPMSRVQLPSNEEGDDDRTCEVGLEEC
jgi:hypothetical protein